MYKNNVFNFFLISIHQNDLKTQKNLNLKQKIKNKILIFKTLLKYKKNHNLIQLSYIFVDKVGPPLCTHTYKCHKDQNLASIVPVWCLTVLGINRGY
jgi:hypothetical protein